MFSKSRNEKFRSGRRFNTTNCKLKTGRQDTFLLLEQKRFSKFSDMGIQFQ